MHALVNVIIMIGGILQPLSGPAPALSSFYECFNAHPLVHLTRVLPDHMHTQSTTATSMPADAVSTPTGTRKPRGAPRPPSLCIDAINWPHSNCYCVSNMKLGIVWSTGLLIYESAMVGH